MALIKSNKANTSNIVSASFQSANIQGTQTAQTVSNSKTENLLLPFTVIQKEKSSAQNIENSFWNYFSQKDKKREPEISLPKIEMVPKEDAIQREQIAYEKGKAEAKTLAEKEYIPQLQSLREKIEESHRQSTAQLIQFTEQLKDLATNLVNAFQIQSMELGFALASAIVQKEITTSVESLAGVIEGVCEQFEESKKITILVHPQDIQAVSQHPKMEALKKNQLIKVIPSEQVDRGGFILDGGLEGIDATLRVRLSKLREIIEKEVAAFLGTGISKLQAHGLIEKQVLQSSQDHEVFGQESHENFVSSHPSQPNHFGKVDLPITTIPNLQSNSLMPKMNDQPPYIKLQESRPTAPNDTGSVINSDALDNLAVSPIIDKEPTTPSKDSKIKSPQSAEKLVSQTLLALQNLETPVSALVKNDQEIPKELLSEDKQSKLPSAVNPEPKSKFPQADAEYQAKITADMESAKAKARLEVEEKLKRFREGKVSSTNDDTSNKANITNDQSKQRSAEEQAILDEQERMQKELAQMFDSDDLETNEEENDENLEKLPDSSSKTSETNDLERELLEEQERMRKEIEEMMQSVDSDEEAEE